MNSKLHTFVVLAYKESEYLEECIKSVVNQTVKSNVVIATSTKNDYICKLAKKYKLKVIENKKPNGIANDFNFAVECVDTPLVTIAHQDDIYEEDYCDKLFRTYDKYNDGLIYFTDYYEIRNGNKVVTNTNFKIKRFLLLLVSFHKIAKFKFVKRSCISIGNAICCPSVTFNKQLIGEHKIFSNKYTCNMDWQAWEELSKMKGRFVYIKYRLMGHRIHEESTTTEIINSGVRNKEDFEVYKCFWPTWIAKILTKLYSNSEKNNKV